VITVAETALFAARAAKRMTVTELAALIDLLASDPTAGTPLGGNIWKLRFSIGRRGKSGGVRVVYFYRNPARPVYLLDVFTKSEKQNLSRAELNVLLELVKDL
jgi:hypothetical protein